MKGRVMQFLFVVGLLLMLGTLAIVIRGIWVRDTFFVERTYVDATRYIKERTRLQTDSRRFSVIWFLTREDFRHMGDGVPSRRWGHRANPALPRPREFSSGAAWDFLGFRIESLDLPNGDGSLRAASVPTWFIVTLLALLTAAPAHRLHRQRRQRLHLARGQCTGCGYDLRGAAHERCPECGADVEGFSRTDRGLPPAADSSRTADGAGASS